MSSEDHQKVVSLKMELNLVVSVDPVMLLVRLRSASCPVEGLNLLMKVGSSLPIASLGEIATKRREMIKKPRLRRLPAAPGPGRDSTVEN